MQIQHIENMFNFTFEKPASEIVERASRKAAAIRQKIEEREGRIKRIREEYKISDAILVNIMAQARGQMQRGAAALVYNAKVRSNDGLHEEDVEVAAGIVNNLLTEHDHIEGERAQVDKLEALVRNLKDLRRFAPDGTEYMQGHVMTMAELKFLGF